MSVGVSSEWCRALASSSFSCSFSAFSNLLCSRALSLSSCSALTVENDQNGDLNIDYYHMRLIIYGLN